MVMSGRELALDIWLDHKYLMISVGSKYVFLNSTDSMIAWEELYRIDTAEIILKVIETKNERTASIVLARCDQNQNGVSEFRKFLVRWNPRFSEKEEMGLSWGRFQMVNICSQWQKSGCMEIWIKVS